MGAGAGLAGEVTPFWVHAAGALSEGIVVRDDKGRAVFVNDAAERILGPAADALVRGVAGSDDWHFVHPDGAEYALEDLPGIRALRDGQPAAGVVLGIQTQSTTRWLSVTSTPIARPDRGSFLLSVFTDVSDQVAERERCAALLVRDPLSYRRRDDVGRVRDLPSHARRLW